MTHKQSLSPCGFALQSVSAYNGAPVSSTPWESQGSLWDLQQPSDLETFYCQLKNSASSSDHQPAAHPLPEPEQLDIARREELLAIQHHLRLSDPHQVEKARREDLLAIQGHLGLSDHSEKGAAGQEEMYAIQRHLRLTQAQAHAAQLPNRQGYQMPPDTLPSLTGAQMPDASAGLLSSPSSGSSQFTDAQQARHVQQAQHTQQAQHLQYVQQMQQGPHFQAQHVPGRLLSEAAPQRSMLRTGSEDVWQGKARHAPAVVIEELPTAAQSAQVIVMVPEPAS